MPLTRKQAAAVAGTALIATSVGAVLLRSEPPVEAAPIYRGAAVSVDRLAEIESQRARDASRSSRDLEREAFNTRMPTPVPIVVLSPTPAPKPKPKPKPAAQSFADSAAWAASPKAVAVARCESGGNPTVTNPSGKYQGKWQMDDSFWRSYGGLAFASDPHLASEAQQDEVAYRGWLARGWQPWSCA